MCVKNAETNGKQMVEFKKKTKSRFSLIFFRDIFLGIGRLLELRLHQDFNPLLQSAWHRNVQDYSVMCIEFQVKR